MEKGSVSIEVLGTGCPNCRKLEAVARAAVTDAGVPATVSKVTDIGAIMARGVMSTPALVIDDKLVSSGRIPGKAEVTSWITAALAARA